MPGERLFEPASLGPWSYRGELLHASLKAQRDELRRLASHNTLLKQQVLDSLEPLICGCLEDIEQFRRPLELIPVTGYLPKEHLTRLCETPSPTKLLQLLHVDPAIHQWMLKRMVTEQSPCVSVIIEDSSVPAELRDMRGVNWRPQLVPPWRWFALAETIEVILILVLIVLVISWPSRGPQEIAMVTPQPPQVSSEKRTDTVPPAAVVPASQVGTPRVVGPSSLAGKTSTPEEKPDLALRSQKAPEVRPQEQPPAIRQPEGDALRIPEATASKVGEPATPVTKPSADTSTATTTPPQEAQQRPPGPLPPVTVRISLKEWGSAAAIEKSCGAVQWVCLDDEVPMANGVSIVTGHIYAGAAPVATFNGAVLRLESAGGFFVGSVRQNLRPKNVLEIQVGAYKDMKEIGDFK